MKINTHELNLYYLDACLPDYFQGYAKDNGMCLAVPVWHGMTKKELAESLMDEWGSYQDGKEPYVTSDEFCALLDEFLANAPDVLFMHLDKGEDEGATSVYAYFAYEWEEL